MYDVVTPLIIIIPFQHKLLWDHKTPTFDVSDDDHDEEAVVVGVVGVVNAGGDLTGADHLLQGNQHQLDGQESHTFIEEVQWAVKDEVPEGETW